jgi:nucleoside-diphosphate-sugar epimerase
MKIVICGGLGYIGTALTELYRNEPDHEIWVVDTKFIPFLVTNLPPNVKYVQGDIMDRQLMERIIDGADLVYQLAAVVEAEKSKDRPEIVWKTNYEAAIQVIDLCGPETRMVFPSSGNVFGGVDESKKFMNLDEEDEPAPKLPYAESKRKTELYLLERPKKNWTIVRFGTNYGYSSGIRFNLVTNIFFKRMIQGQIINTYGGGKNYRPTVHVQDAAGGMKHLANLPEACGQIYHVIRQSYKIRELAETVAGYNPECRIQNVDKEVPFSSYHLSNQKLLATGYEFKFDLRSGIEHLLEVFKPVSTITE